MMDILDKTETSPKNQTFLFTQFQFQVTLDFLLPSKCPPAEVVRPHSQKQLAAGSGDIVTWQETWKTMLDEVYFIEPR